MTKPCHAIIQGEHVSACMRAVKSTGLHVVHVHLLLHMPGSLPAWAAQWECQEVWAGPSWSSYQQCIKGAACVMHYAQLCLNMYCYMQKAKSTS
jgi:hypothetical protein